MNECNVNTHKLICNIYNMASRCVSAISDLNPEVKPRTAIEAHAQTDAIYYEYHYRSYISPVVSHAPVVGCISHI